MWKHLTHPNILPLLGITITPLQLVSNWMPGGDLPDYIKKHSDADRLGLVSVPLLRLSHAYSRQQLSDVAKGLCYLHSCNVIHGDLKGVRSSKPHFTTVLILDQPNILVDDSGHARIADFGLATVTRNLDSTRSASRQHGHTVRWTAPEVLSEGTYSKEADIFSFAMVMIEVHHG
jgi:serine/threonine protein kinase